jgi:ethylene-insensitive protein 2
MTFCDSGLLLVLIQDEKVAGVFNACTAGFTLLCFVLGLLISHPQTPVNMNVMFPKMSGESAYSLMALLGANIIAHNFYTHSSFVQVSFNISY